MILKKLLFPELKKKFKFLSIQKIKSRKLSGMCKLTKDEKSLFLNPKKENMNYQQSLL